MLLVALTATAMSAVLQTQAGCPQDALMTRAACAGFLSLRTAEQHSFSQEERAAAYDRARMAMLPPTTSNEVRRNLRQRQIDFLREALGGTVALVDAKLFVEQDESVLSCGTYIRSGETSHYYADAYAMNLNATTEDMALAGCNRAHSLDLTTNP